MLFQVITIQRNGLLVDNDTKIVSQFNQMAIKKWFRKFEYKHFLSSIYINNPNLRSF